VNSASRDQDKSPPRQQAPGIVLGEIPLTATLPQATGWLPPDACRPAQRRESGILDLRRIDDCCQLSFWNQDGSLLWQESADDRASAEALAQRVFGVKPERWHAAPPDPAPTAGRSFTVTVTRLSKSGDRAFWLGMLLFSVIMMGGMFGSMALGEYLELGEGWQTTLAVIGTLVSMLLALVAGFGLPFWVQNRFFGEDELHTTSPLRIGPDGIALDALGHLPWPALNAIDQVNTEDGEPEAVILLSDAWGKLMLRATGSNSNIALAEKLLDALLTYWRPGGDAATTGPAPTIFHLLPIRRWWHEALHVLGMLLGAAIFFFMMTNSNRGMLGTLLGSALVGFITWSLVAVMPQHFWGLTAANRARAFLFEGHLLTDSSGQLRVDLSQTKVEYVYWRRAALAMDYLLIRAPGTPTLRLAAFDTGWTDFVAAVRERAGQWHDAGSPETHEALREFRG
jgi:hypothetical protein